jgi:hypothetical protein
MQRPRRIAIVLALFLAALAAPVLAQQPSVTVPVRWLDQVSPGVSQGLSFGVPFKQGQIRKEQVFALQSSEGKAMPVQTWPLAYWPDGSMKWIGVATVGGPDTVAPLTLTPAPSTQPSQSAVKVTKTETKLIIDTGRLNCVISQWGHGIIDSMMVDGRTVAQDGELVCILQNGDQIDPADAPTRERYFGRVEKATVEQDGPVRAVIKLEGKHRAEKGGRQWLPFVVRLYFYAGETSVRMVHTIIYDGDEQRDFIRGVGVTFGVPMREELQNRHVRLSGEGSGLFAEPVAPMVGRPNRFAADPSSGKDVYLDQIDGKRIPNKAQYDARGQTLMTDWPKWDAYKLVQLSADGFNISKRTNNQSAAIPAGAGKRASGLAFVGDVSGGLGVSLKNFWQSFPTALEISKATTGQADLTVWIWSPDGPAMDLRHYDTEAHGLEAVYEDVQPGFSTPVGVARTSELMLYPSSSVPTRDQTVKQAQQAAEPAVLVCTPQYLHDAQALGVWSIPDRSTPFKREIEDRLDANFAYYHDAVDQWNWYGFWDYGDVMHSYDPVRHMWRYDLGGMAWDNSELGTDMWLWTMFLRSGRADVYRMAEAMTRHTREVDTYHLGRFAGLGSRHNVRHWGCGAKEARISQAAYGRYFYYLSTDERTGDIMREVVNADYKAAEYDPMRIAQPKTEAEAKYPGRVRGGPDWLAFVGNWMTEWERTGDTKWRDKIYAGMDSLLAMPFGFRSGKNLVFGYDPANGKLYQVSDELGSYNLPTIMGGAEVMFELNQMIDRPDWKQAWLQYCRLGRAPAEVLARDKQTHSEGADASYVGEAGNTYGIARLAAYTYSQTKSPAYADVAINAMVGQITGTLSPHKVEGSQALNALEEGENVTTNLTAQASLNIMEVLEMCADRLPETMPPASQPATAPR